jgi:hypothetical protein
VYVGSNDYKLYALGSIQHGIACVATEKSTDAPPSHRADTSMLTIEDNWIIIDDTRLRRNTCSFK